MNRLQHEVNVLQQQLSECQYLVHTLQCELQVYQRVCGTTESNTGKKRMCLSETHGEKLLKCVLDCKSTTKILQCASGLRFRSGWPNWWWYKQVCNTIKMAVRYVPWFRSLWLVCFRYSRENEPFFFFYNSLLKSHMNFTCASTRGHMWEMWFWNSSQVITCWKCGFTP